MKNSDYHTHLDGKNNPFYNKKHTKETRKIISVKSKEKYKDIEYLNNFMKRQAKMLKIRWGTPNAKLKASELAKNNKNFSLYWLGKKGKSSANWQNGLTSLTILLRELSEYKQWRDSIFKRDNYTCKECFVKGRKLNAHHKKEFSLILQDFLSHYSQFSPIDDKETLIRLAITYKPFWNIDNGITLCEECHNKTKNNKTRKY